MPVPCVSVCVSVAILTCVSPSPPLSVCCLVRSSHCCHSSCPGLPLPPPLLPLPLTPLRLHHPHPHLPTNFDPPAVPRGAVTHAVPLPEAKRRSVDCCRWHKHTVTSTLSQTHRHKHTVTSTLSQAHCHKPTVTNSLSHCHKSQVHHHHCLVVIHVTTCTYVHCTCTASLHVWVVQDPTSHGCPHWPEDQLE